LLALILLIAIAYSFAVFSSRQVRQMQLQKYVGRLQQLKRSHRRHSAFWLGLYGYLWVGAMEFWADLASEMMRLKFHHLLHFRMGLRAMTLLQSTL
jgi:hypothetical protein